MTQALPGQKYLYAAHAGALLLAAAVAAPALGAPDFFQGLPVGMLLAILVILFSRKLRDEYIERLWNAGTAAALFATLMASIGVELARGFADESRDLFEAAPLFDTVDVGLIALAAFFVGFHYALLRGRA